MSGHTRVVPLIFIDEDQTFIVQSKGFPNNQYVRQLKKAKVTETQGKRLPQMVAFWA